MIVPLPPGVIRVNPDLIVVSGQRNRNIFICTVSGTLYYTNDGSPEYVSIVLPISVLSSFLFSLS